MLYNLSYCPKPVGRVLQVQQPAENAELPALRRIGKRGCRGGRANFSRPSLLRVRPPLQPESDATAARQRNDAKGRVQMIRFPTNTGLLPKIDLQLCFNAISPNSERDGSSGRSAPKCTPKIINCVYRFTSVCKHYVAFHNPGASGCPIGID